MKWNQPGHPLPDGGYLFNLEDDEWAKEPDQERRLWNTFCYMCKLDKTSAEHRSKRALDEGWKCFKVLGMQATIEGHKYYMSSLKKNLDLNIYMHAHAYVHIGLYMAWKQRSITGERKGVNRRVQGKIMSGEYEKNCNSIYHFIIQIWK